MHTVEYACISCTDDIDLLKIGQRKKKICNECVRKFFHEVVHMYVILTQWYWLSRQNNKQIQTRLIPISSGNALYCSFKRRQLCINQKSVDLSNNSSIGRLMIWTCKSMVAINLKMIVAQILNYMYEPICINSKSHSLYIIDTVG